MYRKTIQKWKPLEFWWNISLHITSSCFKFWMILLLIVKSITQGVQRCVVMETQQTITCSKSTIETTEKVWNTFKVNNKDNKTTYDVYFKHISQFFLVFLLLTLNRWLFAGKAIKNCGIILNCEAANHILVHVIMYCFIYHINIYVWKTLKNTKQWNCFHINFDTTVYT